MNKYHNLHTFLISLNLCLFCVILLSKRSCGAHYQYESCVPTNCGGRGSPNVSFPFYIPGRQEPYCSYPGFALNCSENGFPVLHLAERNEYVVEDIFYRNRSIHVYNAAVSRSSVAAAGSCLPKIRNTTLPPSQFDYDHPASLRLFSNCTNPLPEVLSRYNTSCDGSEDVKNWDLALYDTDGLRNDAMEICDENVAAPVGLGNSNSNGLVVNVAEVLRKGFLLNWIASDCTACEDSGGRCGFNATNFHFRCFCPDRPHSRSCKPADSKCPKSFECGHLGSLEFPLSNSPGCGLFTVYGCDSPNPTIQLEATGGAYRILRNISTNKLLVADEPLQQQLKNRSCFSFRNLSLPKSPSISFSVSPNLTLFVCVNETYSHEREYYFENYCRFNCSLLAVYYGFPTANAAPVPKGDTFPPECSVIQLPLNSTNDRVSPENMFNLLTGEYILEWSVSEKCSECHGGGGQCLSDSMGEFQCKKENRKPLILALSIGGGGGFLILICLFVTVIMWQRKKRIKGSFLLARNLSYDPSSKPDMEGGGNSYYGIPIFSYKELEDATNHFDPSQELGDGGFGTVYYGKLRDGREVAIKRLYEHNYRRVEQFMNEIKILTCLRHPNLVSLYGCTSRKSRELLLVYEYISNGTVADHLHGERANESPLTWPVRMSVAIETATALTYLHKSDIIHRDVKTNNILLDDNYCVKVADFGLSRLFPNDVTHISTAPQGTPGYVDPEYHQCYQLTDRSDVYSFGVVLIELISSMPAVDITRHRHEINLANLAVNRIQRCEFDELIDSSLGYGSDAEVTRMTTSVAELAFRCLQLDKDMRPCMDEVLVFLKNIRDGSGDCNYEKMEGENGNCVGGQGGKVPPSPETDDVVLLKNKKFQPSPTGVTEAWVSGSSTTTTTSSIG